MEKLSALDAGFLYMESPRTPMHVTALQIYDPGANRVGIKQVIANVRQRAGRIDCYHRKLIEVPWGLGHPYWVNDDNFDPAQHIFEHNLQAPGGWPGLCAAVAELHAQPLDRSKPLWEMHIFQELGAMQGIPANAYAIVTKIHHAAVDGIAGISVTAVLHDLQREPAKQDMQKVASEPIPTPMELLGRTAVADATRPLRALRVLPRLARLTRVSATRTFPPSAPRSRFNGRVSGRHTFDAIHFPLERLREIKLLTPGATVNDVVLTIVGGGLRAYLQAHGELPKQSLTAMIPVSTRKELSQSHEGNEVSQIVVPLGTDIASATERLKAIHQATVAAKQDEQRVDRGSRGLFAELAELPPAPWVAFTAKSLPHFAGNPLVNTVVTNVKAPAVPLYSCGAKLLRAYGSGPIVDGTAIIHTALSYCGELNLSVMSCVEILPDMDFYMECLQRTFEELTEDYEAEA